MNGRRDEALRILYVTNNFPYPVATGLLRHYFLLRELSRSHRVTLLSLVDATFDRQAAEAVVPFTERILVFRRGGSRMGRGLARVRSLVVGPSSRAPAGRLRSAASALTSSEHYDAVFFSGKGTYPAVDAFAELPVVVDMCDTGSSRVRGNLRYASPSRVPLLLLELLEMRRAERSLAERADHLVFASARDRESLFESVRHLRGRVPATVLPNGVDVEYWRRTEPSLGRRRIVFHGSMDWPPNEDAALHLIRDVMPLVWRAHADTELWIVGRGATPALRAAAADPRVTVTGSVPDVRPYLEQAAVFAAPLRFGAGIQNKVLEALAMEVPAVISPLAAAGVRDADGNDAPVALAASTTEFAAALTDRLAAVGVDPAPHRDGRQYVERNFSWSRSGQLLTEILAAAVATSSPGAAAGRLGERVARRRALTSPRA